MTIKSTHTPLFNLTRNAACSPCGWWFSILTAVCIAVPAMAQPLASIDEVVISASKREQSLLDFAGSATVIEAQDLPAQATISDIADLVPGFSVIDPGPRNSVSLVIRGLRMDPVGINDYGGDGGSVASYVDNIPLQGYFMPLSFSLKDLQQVELLRGPQGTLYGNASIAGLIRYITAKPDLKTFSLSATGTLSQTAESDDLNYDTDLVVNAPLIDDTLAVRVLLGKQDNAGFIDNPYLRTGAANDINDDQIRQLRTSMLWQPTHEFSLSASYHKQKVNVGDRQASNETFTGDAYTIANHSLQPVAAELALSSLDASYQFDIAQLTMSVNRYNYASASRVDLTEYFLTFDGPLYGLYDDFSAHNATQVAVVKNSREVRLVSPAEQRFRWLVGAFFSTDDASLDGSDILPGFAMAMAWNRSNDIDLGYHQVAKLDEKSVYSEVAYDVTSQWEILLGARGFEYEDNFTSCTFYPPSYVLDGSWLCASGHDKHSSSLGKFSTKYQLSADHSIYFTVSEGFRRGGANALPVTISTRSSYQPDTSINYELGTHNTFLDRKLDVSAALFYIDWSDIQTANYIQNYSVILNAKGARAIGLELEVSAELDDYWQLRAGYSLTDAELTDDVRNFNGTGENVYAGNTLPGSPREQWSAGVDYTQPLGFAVLDADLTYSYQGDIYTALNSEFRNYEHLAGFDTVNTAVNLQFTAWRLGLFIKNLTNNREVTGKALPATYGNRGKFDYITRPRTIGLTVNYKY